MDRSLHYVKLFKKNIHSVEVVFVQIFNYNTYSDFDARFFRALTLSHEIVTNNL
jgi:hypothetical protein